MITKEIAFKTAFEIKKERLTEKQRRYNMLLDSAYAANPRLNEIDFQLSSVGAQLVTAALSGKSGVEKLKKFADALAAEKKMLLAKAEVDAIEYDCPICSDTGYVGGKICDCVKKIASGVMISKMSDEMPIGDSRFDNFDLKYYSDKNTDDGNPRRRMTAVLKVCSEYVIGFDPKSSHNLLFMGSAGLGKTHLSLAIVSGLIEKGFTPLYGSAENLFMQMEKEKFESKNIGFYESVISADLLVIDDLGAEIETKFSKAALYNILNTRLLAGRPTIINTNLTMKEIEARYTPRISSRLIGSFDAYKFLGDDIRQQRAIERLATGSN